jgi:uncharacterized protein (DUF2236 family)
VTTPPDVIYGPAEIDAPSAADWLLGPGSVAWRIFTTPVVPLIGGLRTLAIEALHPHAMRGVFDHSDYLERPLARLQRTAAYVAATALGTVEEAERAGRLVRSIHKNVRGHDPVTGRPYSADDPESQVWVHLAQWYSYLVAHRIFVGDLTPEEEDRFVAEGVKVAMLVGTPAEVVPSSVAEARAYFEEVKPRLCVTEGAVEAITFVTGRRWPKSFQQAAVLPGTRLLGTAAIATIPRDLRRLMGVDRPTVVDAVEIAAVRVVLPIGQRLAPVVLRGVVGGTIGDAYFLRAYRLRGRPGPELRGRRSSGPLSSRSRGRCRPAPGRRTPPAAWSFRPSRLRSDSATRSALAA